jgi:hypothetical protein
MAGFQSESGSHDQFNLLKAETQIAQEHLEDDKNLPIAHASRDKYFMKGLDDTAS